MRQLLQGSRVKSSETHILDIHVSYTLSLNRSGPPCTFFLLFTCLLILYIQQDNNDNNDNNDIIDSNDNIDPFHSRAFLKRERRENLKGERPS